MGPEPSRPLSPIQLTSFWHTHQSGLGSGKYLVFVIEEEAISLMPNPQPGGPGFFCQGVLALTTRTQLFEGATYSPFDAVAWLQ